MKRAGAMVAAAVCLAGALLATWPVVSVAGWPVNHDLEAPVERVESFRRAFLAFDFFPTWTPFCFNGHGTAAPLFYHRLFNTIAGLLALPLGSDTATRVALVLFMWLGAFGMFRAARTLSISPTRAMLLAMAFIGSPYALTDWLVRSSFAEFASMMITPWLLDATLRQLRGRRVWLPLGAWLAALIHAHQTMGMYLAVVPVLSTLLAFAWARGDRKAVFVDALKAAGLAALLTLPWILAVVRLGPAFSLETLKIYLPWKQFVPWHRYVADNGFPWGTTYADLSVELSRWLLAALVAALPIALLTGARIRAGRELFFLCLLFGAGAFLQFDVATPLYESIPKADLLQFPWRLVAPLLVGLLLIAGLVIEAVASRGLLLSAIATILLLLVVERHWALVQRAQNISYRRFTDAEWKRHINELDGPFNAGEYLPLGARMAPARSAWLEPDTCPVKRVDPAVPSHFTKLEVDLEDGAACTLQFSQFTTPVLTVEGGTVRPTSTLMFIEVPAGTKRRVVIRRRSVLDLAFR